MVSMRNMLVLYSSATCNLKCKYCFIDKNPALLKIDKLLEESFQSDYYLDFAKKVFPDPNQLKELQIWGGEPFLSMDRVSNVLTKILHHYTNCNSLMVSTNFVSKNFMNQFRCLLDVFSKINRPIRLGLQISIDGPEDYTDRGRGKGVTDKFSKRFTEVLEYLRYNLPKNVSIGIAIKPTLDSVSISKLQTREEVIRYYEFFERFHLEYLDFGYNKDKVSLNLPIPNTACPSPHTKDDGLLFANFCKICRDIEKDRVFKFYNGITPYQLRDGSKHREISYDLPGFTCNTGHGMVGLLPNNMVSMCHMAFVDLLGEFKKEMINNSDRKSSLDPNFFNSSIDSQLSIPYEKLEDYERKISLFYKNGTTARLTNMANMIRMEAFVGNIKEKFSEEREAIKAARFLSWSTSYCVRDNVNVTGSLLFYPVGLIRLFFNGAEEYLGYE